MGEGRVVGNCASLTCLYCLEVLGCSTLRSDEIGSISTTPCSTKEIISMGRNSIRAGIGKFFRKSGVMDVLRCSD